MTKLNKKLLTAITAAIPKNNVRYFLNGLFIDYDHKRISATDGHCLVLIEGLPELENGKGARNNNPLLKGKSETDISIMLTLKKLCAEFVEARRSNYFRIGFLNGAPVRIDLEY